jgi:hypothetical protein
MVVALMLVFWRSQEKGAGIGLPRPYRFVGVAITWTLLGVMGTVVPELAGVFGIGFVVALALGLVPGTGSQGTLRPAGGGSILPGGLQDNYKPGRDVEPTAAQLADPNADPNPLNLRGNPQGTGSIYRPPIGARPRH